jgi:predicted RNase H-like nuclease (RuvC/YqgF family)
VVSHATNLLRHLPEQRAVPQPTITRPTLREVVRESEYVMALQTEIGRLTGEREALRDTLETHVATIQVLRAELTDAQRRVGLR